MARDAQAEIVAYNRPVRQRRVESAEGDVDLTAEALRRKMLALAATPFQFFRGTFHLMARDLFEERVPLAKALAPEGLIVGDLHLENFGVYRGASGALVFDVNDFDDVGTGPLDLDLKRLCTSALLVPGLSHEARVGAAKAIAGAWADELIKVGGRFPVPPWTEEKAEGPVRALLREKSGKALAGAFAKAVQGEALVQNDKFVRPRKSWVEAVRESIGAYLESLKQLKAPEAPKGFEVLDVAYRFKGTGSLGRLRFTALLGQGGERRLIELKEARASAMDEARGRDGGRDRARVPTAGIRRMQGEPWPRVAGTKISGVDALGRENEPEEEKLATDRFASGREQDLDSYAAQCGQVLARLQARPNAPAILAARWDAHECAEAAVEFAVQYASVVEADQKAFDKGRAARELDL